MSKYDKLWQYLKEENKTEYVLPFEKVKEILGFDIDHSFLTYKKEAKEYGYEVFKILLKEKCVFIKKK